MFLQETYSTVETEKQWNGEFKGQLYFSHGKTNPCGVLTGFYGNVNVVIKNKLNGKNGRILILEVTIDDIEHLRINIYNATIMQFSNQSKWELLKYEIRKRSIAFSKALAKKSKKEHALLLSKITKL